MKMGGRNHLLVEEALQNLPLVSDVPTCIMGADVSHPPPFDQSQPSIASLVASVDWPCANKYASVAVSQKAREELLRNLYLGPEESGVSGGMARSVQQRFFCISFISCVVNIQTAIFHFTKGTIVEVSPKCGMFSSENHHVQVTF